MLFPLVVELGATAATLCKCPGMGLWQIPPSQATLGTPETHGQWWPQSFQLGIGGAFRKGVFQL